nr:MAG TPA: hypothetical protein [Caudoviricetes sp.]
MIRIERLDYFLAPKSQTKELRKVKIEKIYFI